MHIIARARYFLITHIREIKSGTVTMTALRSGIDIPAALQVFDVLLGAQNRGDVEAVMRQAIPLQYIRPLHSDGVQFAFR